MLHIKLLPDEHIFLEVRPDVRASLYRLFYQYWRYILSFLFLSYFFHFFIFNLYETIIQFILPFNNFLSYFVLAILIFATLIYLMHKNLSSYSYIFTNKRIMIHYNFINKNTLIIPYERIVNIDLRQNLLEQLLGLGTVYISEMGSNVSQQSNLTNMSRIEGLSIKSCQDMVDLVSKQWQQLKISSYQ